MKFVAVGYGKFGKLAVERLLRADASVHILVVEQDSAKIGRKSVPSVTVLNRDAVSLLLEPGLIAPQDVILPMVPFHLAAAFLLAGDEGFRRSALPAAMKSLVPNPFPVDLSTLCCSRADFICPDDCAEGDVCSVTGLPREPLYSYLAALNIPGFNMVVLRSIQILPGLGGYSFGDLVKLRDGLAPGTHILATSCKCHAIMTGLEKTE
jgi:hypothetical protein